MRRELKHYYQLNVIGVEIILVDFLHSNYNSMLPGSPQPQVTTLKQCGLIRIRLAVDLQRLMIPTDGTTNSTHVTMDRAAT